MSYLYTVQISSLSEMSDGEESVKKITVTVKTPKEKQTVEVQENATINEVSAFIYTRMCYYDWSITEHVLHYVKYFLYN